MFTTLFFDRPDLVDEDALQRKLALLPTWRKEQACSYRHLVDKVQSAEAYLLLLQGLKNCYGIHDTPCFGYGANGKPYLPKYPQVHFNLSHCNKGVMCVLADSPVGCDIECIPHTLDVDLLHACCSSDEINRIRHSPHPEVEFTLLWTQKEALLKLMGLGIVDDLPFILERTLNINATFTTRVCEESKYVYTVCQSAALC